MTARGGREKWFSVGIANHEQPDYPGSGRVRTAELVREMLRPGSATRLAVLSGPTTIMCHHLQRS